MRWFRYVARDPRSGETTADVERFADEATARATLAKRGWGEILELAEAGDPGAAAKPALPPPAPANVIGVDGGWSYVDAESAARHPLFGKSGWSVLLGIGLVGGLVLDVVEVLRVVGGGGEAAAEPLVGAITAVTVAYRIIVIVLFFRTSESFQLHFTICNAVLVALAALSLPFIDSTRESLQALRGIVVSLIWIAYVWRSRRINVTFRRRLRPGDPLLPATA